MKNFPKHIKYILLFAVALFLMAGLAHAFIGPSTGQVPGTGGGLLIASSTRALGISTSTVYSTESKLLFRTQGQSRHILFSPSGNVGISKSSPGYTLDVGGNIGASAFYGSGINLIEIDPRNFISGSAFASGNYAVQGSLTVGTSTVYSSPALYVYGSSTISGNLTIGGDLFGASTVSYYYDKTSATYSGSLSAGGYTGYEAGNYICNQEFSGTHMCQEYEVIATVDNKDISSMNSWSGYAWHNSGGAKYTGANPANDCNGWTSSSTAYLGSFWKFDTSGGGSGAMVNCSQSKSLTCCKSW